MSTYDNVVPPKVALECVLPEKPAIHVWQITESDWFAGPELVGCILSYLNDYGGEEEILDFGEPVLLNEEQMAKMILSDDDGEYAPRPFAVALQQMIEEGVEFPCMFATENY